MRFSRFTSFSRAVSYIWLGGLALIVLFPIAWLTLSVFKDSNAIVADPFALPTALSFDNIVDAWEQGDFGRRYLNSAIVTIVAVTGILVLEGAAAYAFARLRFPGAAILFGIFVAGQLVPSQVIVLPSALQISAMGLSDTLVSLILQYLSWAPFAILFLRAAFMAVPKELEEAARIDGAGLFTILWRVILPMTRSAFATVGTIYALWIWNDFLFPLVYLQSADNFTVPLGLAQFQGSYTTYWGYLVGAIVVAVWPPLLVYGLLSRQLQDRLSFAGSKG
ncbi:carbohydrate ABC transporter permease [Herbiconiux sp. KACC 21604]|uniref:carbohydrate ABC transporter permease n=1 Tax=unclassified Herbiconiux TaxID=2618217 RepID=UPI00149131A6|nr:carbohydrate ABC transporter permease [Herbiconiux sp. SALV-R1]QJU55243.1 carbohydrate ABC transporter permease [Herbiconiux sp. SALV-R1]WPO86409.1 carbohydrate ABC transporter permease [Herbiconiux sp. KACC 21604]